MILGLVGGAGSGKSEAALFFSERGARVVDLDRIARDLLARDPAVAGRIRDVFGDAVFRPDGSLDRAALRDRVFSDPRELSRLNAIYYPHFRVAVDAAVAAHAAGEGKFLVIDGAVLFDAGLAGVCERVALIRSSERVRVERIRARSGIPEAAARAMARAADRILPAPGRVDRVFDNDGSVASFRGELAAWLDSCAPARPETPPADAAGWER